MEAHGSADPAVLFDQFGDFHIGKAPRPVFVHFGLEGIRGVDAALAVRMIEVVAHEGEAALRDVQKRALFIAGKDMPPVFQIAETVIGSFKNGGKLLLIAQAVVVIDQFIQQVFHVEFGLHDDHVSARYHAQAAPVARALIHNEHAPPLLGGADRGPCSGKAPADDQNVGSVHNGFYGHG